ncbi:alpha/beta hydrolase [Halobacillus sp. ACCC02827]|uniref:alpha/beta fold hydrolase n=1 Tax=Halobacillus sp. ACCC02827 TaxID=3052090 RepID=UPI00256FC649|nr:alpha/beta hydrolase [Halobacillus sp. ACCC02827]WJE16947.1 alpha/beta hydrolase [Halobacillus sp. ACCC02827]
MSHYIEVDHQVELYVEDIGEGQPIVFLHGWPLNHKMFEYQMNELPKQGYRFIGIDMRGFGKSDKPASGYDYDTLAHDVKTVTQYLQLKDFYLVGFSMGGPIAVRYATKYAGEELAHLILAGAAAPSFTKRDGYPYGMETEEVDELIEAIKNDRPAALKDFGSGFYHSELSVSFEEWFLGLGLEASAHGTIACAESLRDEDLRHELGQINVPTLLIHGKKDEICDFAFSEVMDQNIPDSTLVPFENSGHGMVYDEKEKFNQLLIDLLK